ncbi:hypothetical protein L484_015004 [Morus notabilis]|uniref:Uncharacterized protein n=1 Tax=Morus notabilis TaxID=981085 RepID=W9RMU5_9ROSA|nr:hypothetical protein L484_015004 [Morus notabilis]
MCSFISRISLSLPRPFFSLRKLDAATISDGGGFRRLTIATERGNLRRHLSQSGAIVAISWRSTLGSPRNLLVQPSFKIAIMTTVREQEERRRWRR